jgi:hypothetical protein
VPSGAVWADRPDAESSHATATRQCSRPRCRLAWIVSPSSCLSSDRQAVGLSAVRGRVPTVAPVNAPRNESPQLSLATNLSTSALPRRRSRSFRPRDTGVAQVDLSPVLLRCHRSGSYGRRGTGEMGRSRRVGTAPDRGVRHRRSLTTRREPPARAKTQAACRPTGDHGLAGEASLIICTSTWPRSRGPVARGI